MIHIQAENPTPSLFQANSIANGWTQPAAAKARARPVVGGTWMEAHTWGVPAPSAAMQGRAIAFWPLLFFFLPLPFTCNVRIGRRQRLDWNHRRKQRFQRGSHALPRPAGLLILRFSASFTSPDRSTGRSADPPAGAISKLAGVVARERWTVRNDKELLIQFVRQHMKSALRATLHRLLLRPWIGIQRLFC